MNDTTNPKIGIILIPLITVNGFNFSTEDKTGKNENFDQKVFMILKFIIDNVNIIKNQNFEHREWCDFQC